MVRAERIHLTPSVTSNSHDCSNLPVMKEEMTMPKKYKWKGKEDTDRTTNRLV